MNKKSQLEVMGLAVIVILVSVGILLVIQYTAREPEDSTFQSYSETQLDANFLNALLRTTAHDCDNRQMPKLFQDCASNPGSPEIFCRGGFTSSCEYLKETLEDILNNTMDQWKKEYEFEATLTDIYFKKGECDEAIRREQLLPTDRGIMHIKFAVCK